MKTFDSVGLYVCPGEALSGEYQPKWIKDVILGVAKAVGTDPLVVIRYWGLNEQAFEKEIVGTYDNLYTELKHNIEAFQTPIPSRAHPRSRSWLRST